MVGVVLADGLPKNPVEVEDDVPKEEAPNLGAPVEVSLLWGVVAATPTDPKTDVGVVEVPPDFWKDDREGVVLLAPNRPKPG